MSNAERAAIYGRVSTDTQRDNYSIPSQVKAMVRYATDNHYTIVGDRFIDLETGYDSAEGLAAYVDDYSSRELSRPALDSAIAFLETQGFDVLIVYSLDRLARDPYIRQTLEREITSKGARIEYATGNYDLTPEGEVRKDLDATFAKWENAKRVERCNRGKKAKAEDGKFVAGVAPFGYSIDRDVQGGLAVVEKDAEIVRKIFDWYKDGWSIHKIVTTLNEMGVPSACYRPE